jgi:Transposase and inactivated derivatives
VLELHWSATVNEKTHSFWSHGRLTDRLKLTLGDMGISVAEMSEAGSSSECPECDSKYVQWDGDEFRCNVCGSQAHSDVDERGICSRQKEGRWLNPLPSVLNAGGSHHNPDW